MRHAFSFALFSLNDKLEYLFGYQSKPGEFLSGATELCQRGYVLVALAMSQDFDNWVTLEVRWKGHFRPAGFSWEALDEALSLQRSDAGSDIH